MNIRPLRILLFGYINANVIDGSSFFLSSLSTMLSAAPDVEIDLVLANPLKRLVVLQEVLDIPNVRVIDPFSDADCDRTDLPFLASGSMTTLEASSLLASYCRRNAYDVVFVRSTEVGSELCRQAPEIAARLLLYVTGLVSGVDQVNEIVRSQLKSAVESGASLVCQTAEMRDFLLRRLPEITPDCVVSLNPMVPNIAESFETLFVEKKNYSNYVYTGKFVKEWNPAKIVSGFAEAASSDARLRLDVAGDQFRNDPENVSFAAEVRYLLEHTKGVVWHGGVEREFARELISAADIGISWRSSELDSSLELSTKLLEYGSLGRPCIMNRTPMHERLFGVNYPLFANSMNDYVDLYRRVSREPELVREAAEIAFGVAKDYTYDASLRRFLPILIAKAGLRFGDFYGDRDILEELFSTNSSGLVSLPRHTVIDTSRYTVLEVVEIAEERNHLTVVEALGPIIALGAEPESSPGQSIDGRARSILDFYIRREAAAIARLQKHASSKMELNALDASDPARLAADLRSLKDEHQRLQVKFVGMAARADRYSAEAAKWESETQRSSRKLRKAGQRLTLLEDALVSAGAELVSAKSSARAELDAAKSSARAELDAAKSSAKAELDAAKSKSKAELDAVNNSLENLRKSRLGMMQTALWRLRARRKLRSHS